MINSILIGETVYNKLSTDTTLTSYVGTKIFPLIADADTTFPYVVFSKEGINGANSKDGNYEDTVNVQIVVADNDYLNSLNIANVVRAIFDHKKITGTTLNVNQCLLLNVTEAYDDQAQAFIQRLYFEFKVN